MEERNRVLSESLGDLLSQGKMAAALAMLDGLQPADAAEILENMPYEDRLRVFRAWDVEEASEALPEMSEEGQVQVLQGLAKGLATRILSEMPPDDAVDLLSDLPPKTAEGLLAGMSPQKAGQLRRLMAHGEKTAGGLMTPDAMRLGDDLTVGEVLERLRGAPENIEMIYYVYFQDREGRLTGVNSLRELIIAGPEVPVAETMHRSLITVRPDEDQERVAALIDRYDLLAVPVVDGEGRMLGIVTVDDVMDVIEEEAKEDIYSLAGTWEAEERRERNPFMAAVIGRLPWVFIALALELLVAGGILRAYSDTLRAHIALVFFIPAILSMGGTVSLQSATRMSLDVLGGGDGGRRFAAGILNELLIAVGIAAASGAIISFFARSVGEDARLGMVVGVAMACTVVFAALVGSALPLALKALRRDPSKASEPFLATLMDILGLTVYFLVGIWLI